jgi:capsular exopolysaccharide synthesis family protein
VTPSSPVRDYRRLLRRSRWLLLAAFAIGTAAALGFSLAQTKTYTASASIAFQDVNQQATLVGGAATQTLVTPAQLAAKSSQIIKEGTVLGPALKAAGARRSIASLRGDISTSVDPTTNLVKISVDDHSAATAARLSNAVAVTAVNTANAQARAEFRADAAGLAAQIAQIPNNPANAITRQSDQANLSRLQSLSVVARPASISQTAGIPGSPSSPKTAFNTLIGAALGLMVGFGVAFAREATDRKLRSSEEVAAELDLPILVEVEDDVMGQAPYLLAERDDQASRAVATFGVLRRNVELARLGDKTGIVAVTSAVPEEGKTTVALSLACAFAAVGSRTILVEADLRRPALSARLELAEGPGLGDYLAGQATLEEASRTLALPVPGRNGADSSGESLACLLAGAPPPNPDELLASRRCRELLTELAGSHDVVVLDTSPLLPVADTLELLPLVDAYVVCVRSGRTRRQDLTALRAVLSRLPKQPIGGVATGLARRDLATGAYGYYGDYYKTAKQVSAR